MLTFYTIQHLNIGLTMKKYKLLNKAMDIAFNCHSGQYDAHGLPYIMHPLAVMHKLRTQDEELMCIAILHDVVEDCKVTFEDLKQAGMTDRIIAGVNCLTKITGQSEKEYYYKLKTNKDAIIVKMSDLRHNSDIRRLKGITPKDLKRMEKYNKMYLDLEKTFKIFYK